MWPFGQGESSGQRGEKLAAKHLRRAGLKILGRNYRCPAGEADIIALDRSTRKQDGCETIVFVEVKTRSDDTYVLPETAVNAHKRRQLKAVAKYYLAHHAAADMAVRFDIVSVLIKPGADPDIRHLPGAFTSG